jgi:hypothetical protein
MPGSPSPQVRAVSHPSEWAREAAAQRGRCTQAAAQAAKAQATARLAAVRGGPRDRASWQAGPL